MVTIDHVTAVVADADQASDAMRRLLAVDACAALTLPGMAIRSFPVGTAELHLCAPIGPGLAQEHLERHGPSLHHLALAVDRLEPAIRRLRALGFDILGVPVETASGIVEVFIDPATTAGLWIQLVQRAGAPADSTALDPVAVRTLVDASAKANGKETT